MSRISAQSRGRMAQTVMNFVRLVINFKIVYYTLKINACISSYNLCKVLYSQHTTLYITFIHKYQQINIICMFVNHNIIRIFNFPKIGVLHYSIFLFNHSILTFLLLVLDYLRSPKSTFIDAGFYDWAWSQLP